MAFLPDGRILVTEKDGNLRILDRGGRPSAPLRGLPRVEAYGQGGLMDVALDPDFARNRRLYLSVAWDARGGKTTAVATARLAQRQAARVQADLRRKAGQRLGAAFRIAAALRPRRQALRHHRRPRPPAPRPGPRHPCGHDPQAQPRRQRARRQPVRRPGRARWPEIWSYGHRNPQGLAFDRGDRPPVVAGARAQGRRRGQPGPARAELRLAGDHPRAQLYRHQDHRRDRAPRHGAAQDLLGAVDRPVRAHRLSRRRISALEGQSVRRRAPRATPRPSRA